MDTLPSSEESSYSWVRHIFFEEGWVEVYDLVEFLADQINNIKNQGRDIRNYDNYKSLFLCELNTILETELSGYRFIQGVLSPITDPVEISEIDNAATHFSGESLSAPSQHICTALELLGKKPTPDYRNSIKESISAVESVVSRMAGSDAGGVGKVLEQVSAKVEVHSTLKTAFKQLYSYASDEDGVRHAILDQPTVGYDEAKFMLVACSAFVNFLICKADAAGVSR